MINFIKELFYAGEDNELTVDALEDYRHWIPDLSSEDATAIQTHLIDPKQDKGKLLIILIDNHKPINTYSLSTTKLTLFSPSTSPTAQPCLVEKIIKNKAYNCLLEMFRNGKVDFLKNGADGKPLAYYFFKQDAIDDFAAVCLLEILYYLPMAAYAQLILIFMELQEYQSAAHAWEMLERKKFHNSLCAQIKTTVTPEDNSVFAHNSEKRARQKKITMVAQETNTALTQSLEKKSQSEKIAIEVLGNKSIFYSLRIPTYFRILRAYFSNEIPNIEHLEERFNALMYAAPQNCEDLYRNMSLEMDKQSDPESTSAKADKLCLNIRESLFNYLHIIVTAADNYKNGRINRTELELERERSEPYRKEFIKWETCSQRPEKLVAKFHRLRENLSLQKQEMLNLTLSKIEPSQLDSALSLCLKNQKRNFLSSKKMEFEACEKFGLVPSPHASRAERKKTKQTLSEDGALTIRDAIKNYKNTEKNYNTTGDIADTVTVDEMMQKCVDIANEMRNILDQMGPDLRPEDETEAQIIFEQEDNFLSDAIIDTLKVLSLKEEENELKQIDFNRINLN